VLVAGTDHDERDVTGDAAAEGRGEPHRVVAPLGRVHPTDDHGVTARSDADGPGGRGDLVRGRHPERIDRAGDVADPFTAPVHRGDQVPLLPRQTHHAVGVVEHGSHRTDEEGPLGMRRRHDDGRTVGRCHPGQPLPVAVVVAHEHGGVRGRSERLERGLHPTEVGPHHLGPTVLGPGPQRLLAPVDGPTVERQEPVVRPWGTGREPVDGHPVEVLHPGLEDVREVGVADGATGHHGDVVAVCGQSGRQPLHVAFGSPDHALAVALDDEGELHVAPA
jgi:hypothetical protein